MQVFLLTHFRKWLRVISEVPEWHWKGAHGCSFSVLDASSSVTDLCSASPFSGSMRNVKCSSHLLPVMKSVYLEFQGFVHV